MGKDSFIVQMLVILYQVIPNLLFANQQLTSAFSDFKKLRKSHCFSRHQCRKRISIGLSLSQVRAILDMKMQLCIDFGHLNDYADRFSSSILRKFRWIHPVLPKVVNVAGAAGSSKTNGDTTCWDKFSYILRFAQLGLTWQNYTFYKREIRCLVTK